MQNVTLAIVMELCRLGTLFKLIEWARKVSKLPPEVLSGATPPRSQEEQKLKVQRLCLHPDSPLAPYGDCCSKLLNLGCEFGDSEPSALTHFNA